MKRVPPLHREHDDRQIDRADQRQNGGGAVAMGRVIEGADQRDMAEIEKNRISTEVSRASHAQ